MVVSLSVQISNSVVSVGLVRTQESISDSEGSWNDFNMVHFDDSFLDLTQRTWDSNEQKVFLDVVLKSRWEVLGDILSQEEGISSEVVQHWEQQDIGDSVIIEVHRGEFEEFEIDTFLQVVQDDAVLDEVVVWHEDVVEEHEGQNILLPELTPFESIDIFVNNFAFLEVDIGISIDWWLLDERLVHEAWVGNILLQSEQSIDRVAQNVWMSESVGNVWVSLLVWGSDIKFVTLISVEVRVDWSLVSLLLPSLDIGWDGLLSVVHFISNVSV